MAIQTRINSVRNYLASHFMTVDDEWLSGCVEFLSEDSSHTDAEIQNLAKEQWLLNDLKDICPGSLPPNLKGKLKTVLEGRFILQINAAIDIGTPAYQQYLKLQKVNMENVDATTKFEDKIPNHRMIKLYLTDGVQDVSAIEYKPMRNLSCDITPGCKILIKGPIECRRGVLMLNESAIELLGGEVQEIALTHSLPGILATKLQLPMPQAVDLNSTSIGIARNTNIPTPHTQMPSRDDNMATVTSDPISRPVAVVTSVQVANTFNEDDAIDIDQLAAIEAEFTTTSNKRSLDSSELPNPEKKIKIDTPMVDPNDYPDDADMFADEDDEYLRELEQKFDEKSITKTHSTTAPSEPFVYIKQIKEMTGNYGKVYRVKGQIMKLLSKLSVGKDGWSLRCTIIDGTGNLDVDFTDGVLSELVGFTPAEMNRIKKEMSTRPDLKEKAVTALHKAKDALQVLNCIIELTIQEVPKITALIPFEESHLTALKHRSNSQL